MWKRLRPNALTFGLMLTAICIADILAGDEVQIGLAGAGIIGAIATRILDLDKTKGRRRRRRLRHTKRIR